MKKIVGFILLAVSLSAVAQKIEKPNLTYDVGGNIEFMKLTDAGVLIVANGSGLAGIKPGSSSLHFNFTDYGKVKEEELEFIPMSPYLIINQGGFTSSKKSVIDFVAGKKLFATEENGWKVITRLNVMLPQNKLVVSGMRKAKEGGAMAVGIYDLATGNEEKLINLNNPKKVATASSIPVVSGNAFIASNFLFVPTTKALMCIDLTKNEVIWSAKVDDINWMTADKTGKEIYCFEEKPGGDTKIYKVGSDGQLLWEEPQKVKGKITRFEILPQGLAIVSDVDNSGKSGIAKIAGGASESKIGFLSAATGEDLWEKAPKTKGYVQHFYIMNDGILFGIQSGGINKISFDGNTLFKKPLVTGENIHTMALTSQGMIYITDTDANIINLETGESIWNKPIKYKKATSVTSTYDAKNKRYLISTGSEIIAIDENSGDISTFASYKFQEKESPSSMRARDGGILLTSNQNMMMLNFDGSQNYQVYHKSPGISTFGKIVTGALGAASMMVATSAAVQAGANQNSIGQYNDYGQQMKIYQDGFSDIASASFSAMSKRFKATAATENAQFILTMLNDGVGLIKVNKDTGKNEKEILLKDKKPVYEVDDIEGYLYYKAKNNVIYAFELK